MPAGAMTVAEGHNTCLQVLQRDVLLWRGWQQLYEALHAIEQARRLLRRQADTILACRKQQSWPGLYCDAQRAQTEVTCLCAAHMPLLAMTAGHSPAHSPASIASLHEPVSAGVAGAKQASKQASKRASKRASKSLVPALDCMLH